MASFATLADICIAEPGARLYFSGPRVIAETTREELPEGFGSAERNLAARPSRRRGAAQGPARAASATTCDCWEEVRNLTEENDRDEEQEARAGWLKQRLSELRHLPLMPGVHLSEEIEKLQARLKTLQHERRRHDTWLTVEIARHKDRPRTRDYIALLIDGFEELKGDRLRADDPAIVGGLGWFRGRAVLVVGHQKGRTLDEQTVHNFGMARPEGYRKAQRLFALAERHGLPVLTFVDTPGAYPGVAAEEGGQARAIAESMLKMARLSVPGDRHGDRRGRLRRRPRPRRRRPRADAGERDLLGDLARGLRRHPVARRRVRAAGRRGAAAHGVAAARAGRHRARRRGAARRRPSQSRGRRRQRSATRSPRTLAELDLIPPQERRRQRRERFRKLGQWSDPEQPPGTLSLFGGYGTP